MSVIKSFTEKGGLFFHRKEKKSMFHPEMLKIRINSTTKELYSYFYHLRTFDIIYALLGIKFLLFYVHHYLILCLDLSLS